MMIAIITQSLKTNYGGLLQNYALQTILHRQGHQSVTLDTPPFIKINRKKLLFDYFKRIIKIILGRKCSVFREDKFNREYYITSQHTKLFIDTYISRKEFPNYENFINEGYTAVIVGSDQVWRPLYNENIANSFLLFAKDWNVRKIAYAASFGTDEWEYSKEETAICKELIQQFDGVSVREDSGIPLCKKYLDTDAILVLDPTLLLQAEDYIKLFEKSNTPQSCGNLLCYFLDETANKHLLLEGIVNNLGLTPFRVNSQFENFDAPLETRIQPPVEMWLRGFYDAKFVVTDSFHACVFSIIFKKQFVVYANKTRGVSRYESLFRTLGISSRIVESVDDYKKLSPIDYNLVDHKLISMRQLSLDFLINTLN